MNAADAPARPAAGSEAATATRPAPVHAKAPGAGFFTAVRVRLLLAAIMLAYGGATGAAMLRTSATFDEIVMMAGGARGYATGAWNIAPEHPPGTQYLYGLPLYLDAPRYPDEATFTAEQRAASGYRYRYARHMLWGVGNDGTRLVRLGRLPAVLCGMLLIAVVWAFTRRAVGEPAALFAALLTATLPDLLAHGGVAYNDVPLTLAFLAAVWAGDAALRQPGWARGLLAGVLAGIALGVKNSAIALGPVALVLFAMEVYRRRRDPLWRRALPKLFAAALIGVYATLVIIYRLDFTLAQYRYSVQFMLGQVADITPTYLLGENRIGGWSSFFPIAFLFKTSAAFHALLLVGLGGLVVVARRLSSRAALERMIASPLRAPAVALLVFGALLLRSRLNLGFRYALPVLPLLCVLTAAGIAAVWPLLQRRVRLAVGVFTVWLVAHVASYYPHFLAYMSEYAPGRDEGYRVLVDSSLDWGQGLLELSEFMREQRIPRIYLSYFGTAWPAGYGVEYVPMASFFTLPPAAIPDTAAPPRWVAISATNLTGTYFTNDPFRTFREARPDHVIAHSIYLYRLPDSP